MKKSETDVNINYWIFIIKSIVIFTNNKFKYLNLLSYYR